MIRRLRVRNFKSLEDTCVEFGPVTVLVGRSGTGKTNFVTALRFLRDFLRFGNQVSKNVQDFADWQKIAPATRRGSQAAFEVEFDINGIEGPFRYCITLHPGGPGERLHEESLSLGSECFFHQAEGAWQVKPPLDPLPNPGVPVLGQLPSISDVVIACTALTSGIGCYHFPSIVLATSRTSPQTVPGLQDDANNYLQTLKEIASNLQDLNVRKSILATLQRINPTIAAVELNSVHSPTDVVVGHKFDEKTLSLSLKQESDGFRRFYAHLLALYQRPPKQTLVFEEPENGIYPGALSLLAEEFKSSYAAGRGQVIMTTHSPKLLDHFSADEIRVVTLDGFRTRIGDISQEQKEAIQENLLEPGELLTVDPARIAEPESTSA